MSTVAGGGGAYAYNQCLGWRRDIQVALGNGTLNERRTLDTNGAQNSQSAPGSDLLDSFAQALILVGHLATLEDIAGHLCEPAFPAVAVLVLPAEDVGEPRLMVMFPVSIFRITGIHSEEAHDGAGDGVSARDSSCVRMAEDAATHDLRDGATITRLLERKRVLISGHSNALGPFYFWPVFIS
ncbi:hypothetical protein BDZ89DRAFT_1050064 [Hymenopellis radicata]|nr:hypothetical protein BDZ89DRAFT_1050064 [Hymenopellis radicata]